MFQSETDVGLQISEFIARIIAVAEELIPEYGDLFIQLPQPVGELNLPSPVRSNPLQYTKNLRRKDIPSDDGEIGGRLPFRGLFHHLLDPENSILHLTALDDPILMGLAPRHFLDGNHGPGPFRVSELIANLHISIHHLGNARSPGVNQVVSEEDCERCIPNRSFCTENRMPKTQRLFLSYGNEGHELSDILDDS